MNKTNQLSIETFDKIYNPEKDTEGDIILYEVFGKDFNKIKNLIDLQQVWTLVEERNDTILLPGVHIVNRLNYIITAVPYDDKDIVVLWSQS